MTDTCTYTYYVEGLAPLVFRSGKPFGAQAGADGATFPLPSSLAGLLRTLHADQSHTGFGPALKALAVAGPLLAWREGEKLTPLLPKPADVVYLKDDQDKVQLLRLSPKALPVGCGSDLPAGLLPVVMEEVREGKPAPGPQYWPLDALLAWNAGTQGTITEFATLKAQGLESLQAEIRTHVSIAADTQAAADGQLFQTGGIDMASRRLSGGKDTDAGTPGGGWHSRDLVFLARSDISLHETLATFGGERRLSRVHRAKDAWPQPDAGLERAMRKAGGFALMLVTPALFAEGYRPAWLNEALEGEVPACPGLRVRLRAAAVERWLPVSGWDLAEHKARATRKAVAAGAIYWFELLEAPDGFIQRLWLAPVSDKAQDRLDGFGLVLPRPWTPPA